MAIATFALVLWVRIYNPFGLDAVQIGKATASASDPLHRAGVEATWLDCSRRGSVAVPRCGAGPQPDEVIVRITAAPAESPTVRPDREKLGFAYVDPASSGGVLATVYADRIAAMASRSGVDAATLLGRAISHEIGHLLLGDTAHARHGLMRAEWSAELLRRGFHGDWQFSTAERQSLAARLRARVERAAAVCPLAAACPDCPIACETTAVPAPRAAQ